MNRFIFIVACIWVCLGVTACSEPKATTVSQNENSLSGKLVITGSSTIAPLATELARQFEIANPNTKIDVQTGGSSRGISDVRQHIADIGMVSRAMTNKENDLQPRLLAYDGIAIIVHKSNPVKELSEQNIKDIYLGKVASWKSLNGMDQPISIIHKAEGRSTLEVFLHYFALKNSQIKPHTIIGDNEQAIKLVANNPNAIAYVSIGTAEYDIAHGIGIKTLPLNGVAASSYNLKLKQFPLSRELNFVLSDNSNKLAQAFLAFSTSNKSNASIEGFGFVPVEQR